ncbi:hypothetical protein [Plantactinospora sp. WMMB782]|uniref:hypothetical protein n=1 Tax=Plantactinospora sp. WMMB782 TaxID=3404121 RepID=UPI003B930A99
MNQAAEDTPGNGADRARPRPSTGSSRQVNRPERSKISISLTGSAAASVEEMADQHRVSDGEVVRRAVAVFKFLNDEISRGAVLKIQTPDGQSDRIQILYT